MSVEDGRGLSVLDDIEENCSSNLGSTPMA